MVSIYLTFLNFDGIFSVRTWQRMTDFTQLLVHYGSVSCEYISKQAAISHQTFLDPLKRGYHRDACGQLKPTDVLPAPNAIIEMVRCQCNTDCSLQRCSCRAKNLTCTDLCMCSSSCENDKDSNIERQAHDSDDVATNDE